MELFYEKYPAYTQQKVSICDAPIDDIFCGEDIVRFNFPNGFYLIKDDEVVLSGSGCIEFKECSDDCFSCYIIKRKRSKKGARCRVVPISLTELSKKLHRGNKSIELFSELYGFSSMHWRGTIVPYKKRGLSDLVVIETIDQISMCYKYEEASEK